MTPEEEQRNAEITKVRLPIEQFFGRHRRAWGIWQNKYSHSQESLQQDFTITVLLTNDLIENDAPLAPADRDFYCGFFTMVKERTEEHKRKRREAQSRSLQKRKRRGTRIVDSNTLHDIEDKES